MQKFRCIRTGERPEPRNNDVATLYGYWELEEQLGIRTDPRRTQARQLDIPEITLAAPSHKAVERIGENHE